GMRRARHHVHLDAAFDRANEPLDDDLILVALVLYPKRMLRRVDESCDALAAVVATPDESRRVARRECLPVPIRLEAGDDLRNFFGRSRNDGVIAGLGQVPGF